MCQSRNVYARSTLALLFPAASQPPQSERPRSPRDEVRPWAPSRWVGGAGNLAPIAQRAVMVSTLVEASYPAVSMAFL